MQGSLILEEIVVEDLDIWLKREVPTIYEILQDEEIQKEKTGVSAPVGINNAKRINTSRV